MSRLWIYNLIRHYQDKLERVKDEADELARVAYATIGLGMPIDNGQWVVDNALVKKLEAAVKAYRRATE